MVDQFNPTNQFHPYQAPDVEPHNTTKSATGLSGILSRLGINESSIRSMGEQFKGKLGSVQGGVTPAVNKTREYARTNPGVFLGGLAAAVIGAGLMRKRMGNR